MVKNIIGVFRRNKNFFLLWQGLAVSRFGTYLFDIGMIIWITNETGSAGMISFVLIAAQIPEILFAPVGGALADMFPKNKILVLSDTISGIAVILLGLILFTDLFTFSVNYVAVIIVSIVLGISSASFNPASLAIIPELVYKDILKKSNSIYQSTGKVSELAGQGLGGILFAVTGAPLLFIINGISFLMSAVSETFIRINKTEHETPKTFNREFYINILDGLKICREDERIKNVFYVIAVFHFFIAPLPVLIPFYVTETLILHNSWIGTILALFTGGIISGLSFAGTGSGSIDNSKKLAGLMTISSFIFITAGLIPNIIIAILSLFLLGFIVGLIVVNLYTWLQNIADQKIHGRLFGLLNTITNSTFPFGITIYGFAVDYLRTHFANTGHTVQLLFLFNGLLLLLFTFYIFGRKKFGESYILDT